MREEEPFGRPPKGCLAEDVDACEQERRVEFLQRRLQREKGQLFYICCNNCARFDFEKAHDFGFKCPECSNILIEQDNSKTILHLESELQKLTMNA